MDNTTVYINFDDAKEMMTKAMTESLADKPEIAAPESFNPYKPTYAAGYEVPIIFSRINNRNKKIKRIKNLQKAMKMFFKNMNNKEDRPWQRLNKYRARATGYDKNKWVYGTLEALVWYWKNRTDISYSIVQVNSIFCLPVQAETISKYTGLADITRREVYEGDIVEENLGDEKALGLVVFDKYKNNFSIKCEYGLTDLIQNTEYRYRVIGNKWDNPELIEDKPLLKE